MRKFKANRLTRYLDSIQTFKFISLIYIESGKSDNID